MTLTTYGITHFSGDISVGKIGEQIFVDDFLKFLRVRYEDVTGVHGFQLIDSDFAVAIGRYEIKTNYRDDKNLVIEEYTNYNKAFGSISFGWFYKSKADMLVFLSKQTRSMILLPFTESFKAHYETIKEKYPLVMNRVSEGFNGNKWQSAFRKIPLEILSGYFAYYKRIV